MCMSIVLPGDLVPASHPNLKLGPGLVQVIQSGGGSSVVATKAGELQSSSNGRNWWIESNAKRASEIPLVAVSFVSPFFSTSPLRKRMSLER